MAPYLRLPRVPGKGLFWLPGGSFLTLFCPPRGLFRPPPLGGVLPRHPRHPQGLGGQTGQKALFLPPHPSINPPRKKIACQKGRNNDRLTNLNGKYSDYLKIYSFISLF